MLRSNIGDDVNPVLVGNKIDKLNGQAQTRDFPEMNEALYISALSGKGLDELKSKLIALSKTASMEGSDVVVSNLRHYEALSKAHEALTSVLAGIGTDITSDFLAMDIRRGLFHLGEITGEITTEDLLGNIFSKFCIGK